jgi:hypothetical protein
MNASSVSGMIMAVQSWTLWYRGVPAFVHFGLAERAGGCCSCGSFALAGRMVAGRVSGVNRDTRCGLS